MVLLVFAVACGEGASSEQANKATAEILQEIRQEIVALVDIRDGIRADILRLEDTRQEIAVMIAKIDTLEKQARPAQGGDFSRWLERAEGLNYVIKMINDWLSTVDLGEGVVENQPSPELAEEVTTKIKAIEDPSLDALLDKMGKDFHSLVHALEVALWQPPG